jgi:hypothetical protein
VRPVTAVMGLLLAALTLAACQDRHQEPVPPPKSAGNAPALPVARGGHAHCRRHVIVSEISWFQGTLEEAFARHQERGPRLRQ